MMNVAVKKRLLVFAFLHASFALAQNNVSEEDTLLLQALSGPSLALRTAVPSAPVALAAGETCTTPPGQKGICKLASQCPSYVPLVANISDPEVLNFFRERICRLEFPTILFCCLEQPPSFLFSPAAPDQRPPVVSGGPASPSFPVRTQDDGQPLSNGVGSVPGAAPNERPSRPSSGGQSNQNLLPPPLNTFSPQRPQLPSLQPQNPGSPSPPPPNAPPVPPPSHRPPGLPSFQPQQPNFPPQSQEPGIPSLQPQRPDFPSLQSQRPSGPPIEPQQPLEPNFPPGIPKEQDCGLMSETIPAKRNSSSTWRPWLVAVGQRDGSDFRATCGGALITRRHVLVAAHCMLSPHLPKPTQVRIGDGVHIKAEDFAIDKFVDAGFNAKTLQNDIGLITLDRSVILSDSVRPICLPYRFSFDGFRYQEVEIAGWSRTATSVGDENKALEMAPSRAEVIGLKVCENLYQKEVKDLALNTQQMCALVAEGQPCENDNGALLTYLDDVTTNRYYVVGLVSFGYGCERPSTPSTYARVGAFLRWIESSVQG